MLSINWSKSNSNVREAMKFWAGVIYDAYGPCEEDVFARWVMDGLRAEGLPCNDSTDKAIRHMREAMMNLREG